MLQPITIFLGNTSVRKSITGCTIALTGYGNDVKMEEWHSHENSSLSLLLNGNHQEYLLGQKLTRITGDVKFIAAGEQHRCTNYASGTQKINLDLKKSLLRDMEVSDDNVTQSLHHNREQAKFTLLKLYNELNDNGSHNKASTQLLLYELLKPVTGKSKYNVVNPPRWAVQLKEMLNDEWNTSFDLHHLAGKLGVHPVTISRYFPQYFGPTLGTYLKSIKIDRSLNLIRSTTLSLTEIAYICGFADQAHFTRTFKAFTGFLPKYFRKI